MLFDIVKKELTGEPVVGVMSHNGETLEWAVTMFRKSTGPVQDESLGGKKTIDFEKVLSHINGYWKFQSPQKQTEIFGIYKEIRAFFDEPYWENNISTLYELVKRLYVYHDIKDIHQWMIYHDRGISRPEYLREEFVRYSGYTCETAEKTYTRSDYMWLLALAIGVRAMIPVWGEYIARNKGEVRNLFKEYHALKLLNQASISHSIPYERLKVYIEHNLPPTLPPGLTLNAGISVDEYPVWMISVLLIRKLTIIDLSGNDKRTSVIAGLHSYMLEKNKRGPDASGMVRSYSNAGNSSDQDNNLSALERGPRVKQVIPTGYFVMLEIPFNNPVKVAQHICPDISPELVMLSLESVDVQRQNRIKDPQVAIASWVLAYNNTIVPRSLQYLPSNVRTLSVALAIAQAVLWHKGYTELAPILTAIERLEVIDYGGNDSRSRVTREQATIIEALFPLVNVVGSSKHARRNNRVLDCIENIAGQLDETVWQYNISAKLVNKKELYIPTNIKQQLADLIIRLNTKQF